MDMKQLQKMMKQAQGMQRQLEEKMNTLVVEASSGGGMVTITMDGKKVLKTVKINPDAVDPSDVDMLQDLILAAVNEGSRKVDEAMNSQLGDLSGGLLQGM